MRAHAVEVRRRQAVPPEEAWRRLAQVYRFLLNLADRETSDDDDLGQETSSEAGASALFAEGGAVGSVPR